MGNELINLDWPHVLAIGGDDRHWQARNANIEEALRRSVDDAQPHAFSGAEQIFHPLGWPTPIG